VHCTDQALDSSHGQVGIGLAVRDDIVVKIRQYQRSKGTIGHDSVNWGDVGMI